MEFADAERSETGAGIVKAADPVIESSVAAKKNRVRAGYICFLFGLIVFLRFPPSTIPEEDRSCDFLGKNTTRGCSTST